MKYSCVIACLVSLFLAGCKPSNVGTIDSIAGLENKPDLLSMSQGAVILSASSQWDNVSLDAFHLFDDCVWTKWSSASGKALNNAFDIELQSPCRITDIVIDSERMRNSPFPELQAKTVRILASATSPVSGYEQLAETVLNKGSIRRIAIDPKVNARPYKWLRFMVMDNWGDKDATVLYEIQAYGNRIDATADNARPNFKGGVYGGEWSPLKFVTKGSMLFGCACKPDESDLDMLGSIRGNQARVFMPLIGGRGVATFTQSASGDVVNITRYYRFSPKDTTSNLYALQRREKSPSCKLEPISSADRLIGKYLEHYQKAILYGIDFKPDSAELTTDSDATLNAVVSLLKNQPKLRLSVEAHNGWTDSNPIKNIALDYHDDSIESHNKLSEARAQAVVDWLCNHKVERSRLKARGWGKEKPVHLDGIVTPSQSVILNRRIEIIPLDGTGKPKGI